MRTTTLLTRHPHRFKCALKSYSIHFTRHYTEGYDFHAVPCDVTDYDSCAKAVAQAMKDLGPVDVLVNNAGIKRYTTFKKARRIRVR